MKLLLKVPASEKVKAEGALKSDDKVSRASITLKDGTLFGKEGVYYILIEGDEEAVERAKDLVNTEEVVGAERKEILEKIEEEESRALSGFGAIMG